MQLTRLQLKNFRCFDKLDINLSAPLVLIEGSNGSGKTSILEALSYLCYLRSFRTHITKELIHEKSDNFFVKAEFANTISDVETNSEIKVGFSGKKRLVKINDKAIQSYKDLMQHYRIITLTEDDLDLIKDGPELRRTFIDQHIMLHNPQSLQIFRKYKKLLENRNALLYRGGYKHEDYLLWTKSLWEQSSQIQSLRKESLRDLERAVKGIISLNFQDLKIIFRYEPKEKQLFENFDEFLGFNQNLYESEQILKRTLFGAHLDDFSIIFQERKTKSFASRGQQKLLVLLIKIAQIELLSSQKQGSVIFLLDDFMTDLDSKRLEELVNLLCTLNTQLIFTCPLLENSLKRLLSEKNSLIIQLDR